MTPDDFPEFFTGYPPEPPARDHSGFIVLLGILAVTIGMMIVAVAS